MNKLSMRNICVSSSKRGKMLYSRCFDDPHKYRDSVPGRVPPSRLKVVHNCKTIFTVVLSGWLVRCATYFTNRKGGHSCLFKWSKSVLVTDIYNNKQTTLFIQKEREIASLFKNSSIKEHTARPIPKKTVYIKKMKRWLSKSCQL